MFVELFSLILRIFVIITTFILLTITATNLFTNDGTSTAELLGGDVFFEIVDPIELEYTYRIRPAKDFGASFNASFHLRNVLLVPVYPKEACDIIHNAEDVEGNVALIQRGECSFKRKAIMAEMSGARAAIITDIAQLNEEFFIEMIDDDTDEECNIPSGFLMGKNGIMILKTLEKLNRHFAIINLPVNLTFTPVHKMNQPPWMRW